MKIIVNFCSLSSTLENIIEPENFVVQEDFLLVYIRMLPIWHRSVVLNYLEMNSARGERRKILFGMKKLFSFCFFFSPTRVENDEKWAWRRIETIFKLVEDFSDFSFLSPSLFAKETLFFCFKLFLFPSVDWAVRWLKSSLRSLRVN